MTTTIGDRMVKIETQMISINKTLDTHCLEQRQDFEKIFKKLDALDNKFAGKWVEKVTIGVSVSIITAIVVALVQLL